MIVAESEAELLRQGVGDVEVAGESAAGTRQVASDRDHVHRTHPDLVRGAQVVNELHFEVAFAGGGQVVC